jgi:hypothetical protein
MKRKSIGMNCLVIPNQGEETPFQLTTFLSMQMKCAADFQWRLYMRLKKLILMTDKVNYSYNHLKH